MVSLTPPHSLKTHTRARMHTLQFSSGGAQFYAGKGLDNTDFKAAIAGAVSGAYHVRAMAEQYGVPVILHTDHCGACSHAPRIESSNTVHSSLATTLTLTLSRRHLRQETSPVDGRYARGVRDLLRCSWRAALLEPHARPFGGAA